MNAAIAEHKVPYKSLAITPSILANGLESRGNELKLVDIDGLIAGHSDAFNIFCCDGSDACPAVAVAVVFAVVGAAFSPPGFRPRRSLVMFQSESLNRNLSRGPLIASTFKFINRQSRAISLDSLPTLRYYVRSSVLLPAGQEVSSSLTIEVRHARTRLVCLAFA